MANEVTVRVHGLRELNRALNKVNREASKEVRDALAQAGRPVADLAQMKLARYVGLSTRTIRPKATSKGVFVEQAARKTTGLRPDFGALQMRVGLIPARAERFDATVEAVEDALDKLGRRAGF